MSFVYVTHESAPSKAYRVPEHFLSHPTLGAGLTRVSAAEVERDKTVVEPDATAPKTGRKANTSKE